MRGLKLTINGRLVCVAAVPDNNQLQSTVVFGGRFGNPEISVNGFIEKQPHVAEYLKWGKQHLKIGDVITMELVHTDSPDQPIERHVRDSSESNAAMTSRIEEHIARLRIEIEQRGKEAVLPKPQEKFCSFCGKAKNEVKKLVAGPNVFICDECIAVSNDILNGKHKSLEDGQWPVRDA